MSDPSRPVSGFVPLGDMAGAVDLPGSRGLSPATPQARHHFTTLHQVNQLVEASEADADLGFMARLLALCVAGLVKVRNSGQASTAVSVCWSVVVSG